jgi:hypothetical protein
MRMSAEQQCHARGQRHAEEYKAGARSVLEARDVVLPVDLVVWVVAVVVGARLGDGLDDGCDVEEGAALGLARARRASRRA